MMYNTQMTRVQIDNTCEETNENKCLLVASPWEGSSFFLECMVALARLFSWMKVTMVR
jgi:hypothetical protein